MTEESASASYDTDVPSGESAAECPHCGRPLESEELLVLHEGLDHWDRLDDDRREQFREAYQREADDLRTFRLKMLALLILVYFVFLFVYSWETTDPFEQAAPLVWAAPAARGWFRELMASTGCAD